ncbi:MAG: hypothetical protein WCK75_09870 [Elusimicrobiota bacterium]
MFLHGLIITVPLILYPHYANASALDIESMNSRGFDINPHGSEKTVTASHAYTNHYETSATVSALEALAAEWKSVAPGAGLLKIGDISLPWGGTMDRKDDWKAQGMSHGFGIEADIGKPGQKQTENAELIRLMCGGGFIVRKEINEGGEPHSHIIYEKELKRVKTLKWPVVALAGAKGEMNCCTAQSISREYQICVE